MPTQLDRTISSKAVSKLSPSQMRVLQAVQDQPGSVISDVACEVGCSHNNASRHLGILCDLGILVREKHGRGVRHYCAGEGAVEARLEAHFRDEKRRRAIQLLAARPDRQWVANELARESGLGHEFVQRLLRRLKHQGLVQVHIVGARRYVQASPRLVAAMRRSAATKGSRDASDDP